VTLVRPEDSTSRTGDYNSRTTNVPRSLSDSSRLWNKNHLQNTTCKEEEPFKKPSKKTPNKPRIDRSTTAQRHMNREVPREKSHHGLASVRPVKSTGKTGRAWAAWDEQRPLVNSCKSNF
jgi:hypothetical protein